MKLFVNFNLVIMLSYARCLPKQHFAVISRPSSQYVGNGIVGVLREQHNMWERRAPITPQQVLQLKKKHPNFKVIVQPCSRRIFSDKEYEEVGAELRDDLSSASLIVGVKAPPATTLLNEKSYMFFAHIIKAQPYSMPLLDAMLEKKVRLFDYECITEGGRDDTKRSVAFGKYAGRAGMIDGLQGLGLKLLSEGFSTPLLNVPCTYMHANLEEARNSVRNVGAQIAKNGLPSDLGPVIIAFTGGEGNVAKGAKEIFELLPHKYVSVEELPGLRDAVKKGLRPNNVLYGVDTTAIHMVKETNSTRPFNEDHYFKNPENYEPIYQKNVLPYVTMLVNGMYWDRRYPRLVTKAYLKDLRSNGNSNFKMVADISCDIEGSCEITTKASTIESPFFTYLPETDDTEDGVASSKGGVLMMTIDNLPAELPRDASDHFGSALLQLLPPLLVSSGSSRSDPFGHSDLPLELRRACLLGNGELLPKWSYIHRLREQHVTVPSAETSSSAISVNIEITVSSDNARYTQFFVVEPY